jgi:hypothetical protein
MTAFWINPTALVTAQVVQAVSLPRDDLRKSGQR